MLRTPRRWFQTDGTVVAIELKTTPHHDPMVPHRYAVYEQRRKSKPSHAYKLVSTSPPPTLAQDSSDVDDDGATRRTSRSKTKETEL